jgi:hypothetical protein
MRKLCISEIPSRERTKPVQVSQFGYICHLLVLRTALYDPFSLVRFFHGFLTYPETVELLSTRPSGHFLFRFSRSQPGSLVVAFKSNEGRRVAIVFHFILGGGLE